MLNYQSFFTLYVIFDEMDRGLGHEKKYYFAEYNLYHFFLRTVMDDLK